MATRKSAATAPAPAPVPTAAPAAASKPASGSAPKPVRKPASKPAGKPASKPARKAPPAVTRAVPRPDAAVKAVVAATASGSKVDKPRKADKPKKAPKLRPVLVRDSFTLPEADFALIGTLKARALAGQRETKKSELLRAGLQALAAMDSATLLAALNALEPIKTGRPKKGH